MTINTVFDGIFPGHLFFEFVFQEAHAEQLEIDGWRHVHGDWFYNQLGHCLQKKPQQFIDDFKSKVNELIEEAAPARIAGNSAAIAIAKET